MYLFIYLHICIQKSKQYIHNINKYIYIYFFEYTYTTYTNIIIMIITKNITNNAIPIPGTDRTSRLDLRQRLDPDCSTTAWPPCRCHASTRWGPETKSQSWCTYLQ